MLVGGSCPGMYFSMLILQRIGRTGVKASCSSSCDAVDSPSLDFLRRNEATIRFKHPLIKSVDVNYLPSNSPNEDRFVVGGVKSMGAGLISVIDGHKGNHCSEYIKNNLLQYVTEALTRDHPHRVGTSAIFHTNPGRDGSTAKFPIAELDENHASGFDWSKTEDRLKEAFLSLDHDICDDGLEAARHVKRGRSIREGNFREAILTALAGACALLSVVTDSAVYVASTGDCRAVLGTKQGNNSWSAKPLSLDQDIGNPSEVKRLFAAHPGEENTVISRKRLLGDLVPLRSFGDVDLKWKKGDLDFLVPLPEFYQTPPYLTAEPVVTHTTLQKKDRFIVIASDGLWERLSNKQVVRIVGESGSSGVQRQFNGLSSFFSGSKEQCCVVNSATHLLWEALGGEEMVVRELLHIPQAYRRMYRDDITILVVHLH